MGDKAPKKKSSGSSDAHKAKLAKAQANKFAGSKDDKNKGKKK